MKDKNKIIDEQKKITLKIKYVTKKSIAFKRDPRTK
jgi:hypothetical protein